MSQKFVTICDSCEAIEPAAQTYHSKLLMQSGNVRMVVVVQLSLDTGAHLCATCYAEMLRDAALKLENPQP